MYPKISHSDYLRNVEAVPVVGLHQFLVALDIPELSFGAHDGLDFIFGFHHGLDDVSELIHHHFAVLENYY